jgi:hypothetical protein
LNKVLFDQDGAASLAQVSRNVFKGRTLCVLVMLGTQTSIVNAVALA